MRWAIPDRRLDDEAQIDELLALGTYDWIQPGDVFDVARFSGHTELSDYVGQAIHLAEELIRRGLVVAGDIDDGRHVPWQRSTEEAIRAIADHWRTSPDAAQDDSFVWFESTDAGLDRGEAVCARANGLDQWTSPARIALASRAAETGQDPDAD